MHAWEDVVSTCPRCGGECGTLFHGERKVYEIPPHGRMGNKSYREDPVVGTACDGCGLEVGPAPEGDGFAHYRRYTSTVVVVTGPAPWHHPLRFPTLSAAKSAAKR